MSNLCWEWSLALICDILLFVSYWTCVMWDFKLLSCDSSKASTGESKKQSRVKCKYSNLIRCLDNPYDTSRIRAWNSAYSTEWTLVGHLLLKLHRARRRFVKLLWALTWFPDSKYDLLIEKLLWRFWCFRLSKRSWFASTWLQTLTHDFWVSSSGY